MTASAGHARDWVTSTATDGVTDGATHPGDSTDAYWSSGDSFDNSGPVWPGEEVSHDAAQNLQQERAPMTISQWAALPNNLKVGNFWVIDHQTGWAYWANQLQAGETTSYLLDAAEMTAAANAIPGEYYYGIHVDGQLISPDRINDFLAADGSFTHHDDLSDFLTAVQTGSIDNNWGNPGPDDNVQPDQINFSIMAPGTIFTMAGEQYRYLENQGGGNHLIIRNNVINNARFHNQESFIDTWYSGLDASVRNMVQPVANTFTTGFIPHEEVTWTNAAINSPTNLYQFPEADADVSRVVPGGTPRAFPLSVADVTRLFGNRQERRLLHIPPYGAYWMLRTPGASGHGWIVSMGGWMGGDRLNTWGGPEGGARPALIINQ